MDVRKRKGSKTNLTTGKKSSKYRKVTLDENLSPDVLSNPDISLEPVQNEHETDLNQSQNENNSVDVVTYAEIGLQTYRIPSVDTSIHCRRKIVTSASKKRHISSLCCSFGKTRTDEQIY